MTLLLSRYRSFSIAFSKKLFIFNWRMIALHYYIDFWVQKELTLKYELPRLVGTQYATVEERRNNSRRN